jgi:hypothetical protein
VTTLSEFQFEILPHAEANDGFVFGIGATVSVDGEDGLDTGDAEWLTQDSQNTRRGVNVPGRDVKGAKTWTWSSHVNQHDVESALETLEDFETAWDPEELVLKPGAVTAVRYCVGGRNRRIFGRPRRFAAPPSNRILNGFVPVTHDFQMVDAFTYEDQASTVTIPFASEPGVSGIKFPVVLPTLTIPRDETQQAFYVGGSRRTYPVIRFYGPWTNPSISTDDWQINYKGSVANGGFVEIDARPWVQTTLNHSGASAVGGLEKTFHYEDIWLRPKTNVQVRLGGVATGAGAFATVTWRDAYRGL